jgi:hypothetical protein
MPQEAEMQEAEMQEAEKQVAEMTEYKKLEV